MNLKTIAITPFAQGIIKVDCEAGDEPGTIRTRPGMVVCARHHETSEPGAVAPALAKHPIQDRLMEREANREANAIVEVPVKMFFNKTDNAITANYRAYDTGTGAPLCTGDGKNARRLSEAGDTTQTITQVPCPGPDRCAFAQAAGNACRRQVKMVVQIDGQDDLLSVFEVRSSSINNFRSLTAQLRMIELRFAGLRHVPLKLQMWKASSVASNYQPFDLLRLSINAASDADAMATVKQARDAASAHGMVDEFDTVFEGAGGEQNAMELQGDDFQRVSDFYEPTRVARRVTQQRIGSATATEAARESAGSVIADAVRRATENRTRASEPEGVEPRRRGFESYESRHLHQGRTFFGT